MGSRVECFEQIRRDRDREGLSIRALAARHGVHRRAVRQALASPLPPPRKRPTGRPAPKLGDYRQLIDQWLTADQTAPRKQRHSARRIFQRLTEEHGAEVSERAVRKWVAARRRELGDPPAAMVPLVHDPGAEAEVDWGQAVVILRGRATKVFIFHMRACHSGGAFAMAFAAETQQAFLEAHVAAFDWFGGVFGLIRYDNLKAAVAKILKGRRRVESDRFIALRSHYLFESSFCLPGQQGAHEKGGVEGEVGRFRRRHLVPVPQVASLAELNGLIAAGLISDLARTITGRSETVGQALVGESAQFRPLPVEAFDARETTTPRVDSKALVTVRQNRYSVPVCLVGRKVLVKIGAAKIEVFSERRLVASHERLQGRYGVAACLDHYLELLARKPGALRHSLPLRCERDRGGWPSCLDALWAAIEARYGASEAARQMVDVLLLAREITPARLELAVRGALAAGSSDGHAVALLARSEPRAQSAQIKLEPRLAAIGSEPGRLDAYDQLLAGGVSR